MVVSAVAVGVEKTRAADGVELIFLDGDGDECRGPLAACWGHRFEDVPPVREFGWHRGQAHWPGLWWSATTGRHVGYESWLERDEVMALDFDREVVAFSSQPFWLCWPAGGRRRRHAPDFFARLADGTGLVIDVRAAERIEPRDAEAFELTRRACRSVGWRYRRVGGLGAVVAANLRWLSGYRHPRCLDPSRAAALGAAFAEPAALMDGVRAVGDPIAVLPVLFHLLWTGVLHADLQTAPLGPRSLVAGRVDP